MSLHAVIIIIFYVVIQGEKLNLVLTKDDVTVLIGVAHCNVTSIAETQLTCRPPMPEAEGVGHDPAVTVSYVYRILWLHYGLWPHRGLMPYK